jgi:peptide chain release factor 1
MLEKIKTIIARYDEINQLLETVADDYQKAVELAKERSELEAVVQKAQEYQQVVKRREEALSLEGIENDAELRQLADMELEETAGKIEILEKELKALLLPKDPRDDRNVIFEIRAGTGGDEAALFAADLYRMYSRYAERKGWDIDLLSENATGIGGYKEVIFMVKGKGAYSRLKYESGVHRVQRIPLTESSGRIHTSTITVAVLAEVQDVDIHIPDTDIRMDVYRSAGAGGQNVQKNSTAVRITHLPTGIVVACQDERSQLQNRLRGLSILRARLYDIELQKNADERDANRRSQVGSGERSEKIRTYNYPQSRVTDHRINISSYNLATVVDGELDLFIDELALREESDRLSMIGLEENGD